jgi:hypothetical protein
MNEGMVENNVAGQDDAAMGGNVMLTTIKPMPIPYYENEVNAVHEAVQTAIDLIQQYSEEIAATKDVENDTSNPDFIYEQLDHARNQITAAWDTLRSAVHEKDDHPTTSTSHTSNVVLSEQEQIRIAYLNMITDSFADVLENLRSNANDVDDPINVDVLADCLQSGYDLLTLLGNNASTNQQSWSEQDFLWNDENDDWMNDTPDTITPHERHRQELGFQLIN